RAQVDERRLAERVARHARETPDAPAIRAGDETISYAELDARTNALARRLLDEGLRPEEPVAVLVERGADVVLALLGIWKAGGAYLPLDAGHPPQRIAQVLEDAAPRLAVATCELPEGIVAIAPRQDGDAEPVMRATPASLSHVIYTSGSTGTPKGVLVEHRGLPHLAAAHTTDFAVTAS